MKKRVISVVALLLVVLSVASLAACGGNKIQAGTYKVTEVTGDGAEAIGREDDVERHSHCHHYHANQCGERDSQYFQ